MRSYYDAGIPSPSAAFDESFQILFERVSNGKHWEKAKDVITASIKKGCLSCSIYFGSDAVIAAEELETVLRHLGYHTYTKNAQDRYGKILIVDWDQDYGKRI